MNRLYFLLLFTGFQYSHIRAQYSGPAAPTFPSFTPTNVMGGNSKTVAQGNNDFARQRMMGGKKSDQLREINELLQEEKREKKYKKPDFSCYRSPDFIEKTRDYRRAAHLMQEMLIGRTTLSVSRAYYALESAYGNCYMSYTEFKAAIDKSGDFMKRWMQENGVNHKDNESLNLAIQKFMSDTLTVTMRKPDSQQTIKMQHLPFRYDYIDFKAEDDFRNYFVTKSMATGYGQCNSLPLSYLCFAEKLGAKAYLTFAPQHSFIKYPDNHGNIHNYEPTSHWNISDRWYQDDMGVSKLAIQKGIYLDTLNKRQIIANCLIDLAFNYLKQYGAADGSFVMDCIDTAKREFPRDNNININFLYSSFYARQLTAIAKANQLQSEDEIHRIPQAAAICKALEKNEQVIKDMGYERMPDNLYLEMMGLSDARKKAQEQNGITGKQKRNLFITTSH